MPHRSLADFLDELGRTGELARIDCEVEPHLEVAEITRRVARQQGPALLFRKLRGYDTPLITNLLGTETRILAALEAESIEAVQSRIEQIIIAGRPGDGWIDRLRLGSRGGPLSQAAPHKVKSAACQQVVRLQSDVQLDELPRITVAAEEKIRTLASVPVFFADPDSHAQHASCFDVQIVSPGPNKVDKESFTLNIGCWGTSDESARIFSLYTERKQSMPVAVVLGGDPAVLLAAMAPIAGADPLALAGILRTKPLDAVACRTIDLFVPAESDLVIEGTIDPWKFIHGLYPCVNSAGALTSAQDGREMLVTAVTHRANAVMTQIVRSTEANEASILSRTLSRMFLPTSRMLIPSLVDYDLPLAGGGRSVAIASIDKHCVGQAQRVAALALAAPGLSAARVMIIVDRDVDVRDFEQVLRAIALHAHPELDFFHDYGSVDPGDALLMRNQLAPRLSVDATRKRPGETGRRNNDLRRPDTVRTGTMPNEIVEQVAARWAELGLGP